MSLTQGALPRNLWSGLSTDTKPTDSRINTFDQFYETDTGKGYIYANGAWVSWPPTQPVTQPAGARNPSSAVNGYLDVRTASPDPRVLSGIAAISVAAGVIGQAGGAANDTQLMQVILLKNAGPATLTIAGFKDQTGAAQNILLSGSSTADTIYNFDGLQNSAGAMILTPSVTLTAIVSVRPS